MKKKEVSKNWLQEALKNYDDEWLEKWKPIWEKLASSPKKKPTK